MSAPLGFSCLLRRVPRPPLCHYINCFWYAANYSAAHALERVLPTGTVDLVIRLDQAHIRIFDDRCQCKIELKNAVISGAHSRSRVIETKQQSSVVGVHFRPAGAALFFAQPFGELTNLAWAAEDVWGSQIIELREQLLEAASPTAMFDLLELALMKRLVDPPQQLRIILRALGEFVASPTLARVRQVCDATGYSPKRFIRHFENYVGLTPKMLCRVLRFQAVLERVVAQQAVNWAKVALDCGYFDQSHLIRDFREFSGICPSKYRPVEPERRNHIALNP